MSWHGKSKAKEPTVPPATIDPSELIYGNSRRVAGSRKVDNSAGRPGKEASSEITEETVPGIGADAEGFSVSLKESSDPFLRSGRQAWIYRILTPDESQITGSARSRRQAERKIRQEISREREAERKRQAVAELRSMTSSGYGYGYAQDQGLLENPTFRLSSLPGGYKAISYAPPARGGWGSPARSAPRWQAAIFCEEDSLCVRTEASSRRGALRSARQELNASLARRELRQDEPEQ